MAAKRKRSGPKPRGLVKKTIVMSKTRAGAIVRAVAEGRAPSASGYIEQALAAYAALESYDELLAEWRREVGAPTASEQAWARAAVKRAAAQPAREVG
jgi:hypothetical protein